MSTLDSFFATVKLPPISEVAQGLHDKFPAADSFISLQ